MQRQVELSNFHGEIAERITPGYVGLESYFEHIERYRLGADLMRQTELVVDIACGTGYGSHYLVRNGPAEVVGIDHVAEAIAYAQVTYARLVTNLSFVAGDAFDIPLRSDAADGVISFETIEHIRESRGFLEQIHRILKPGGLLVISTPNKAWSGKDGANPYHVNELSLDDLIKELEEQGFPVKEIFGQSKVYPESFASSASPRQMLAGAAKSILPRQWQDYVRRTWLLPRRTGVPGRVFEWYMHSPLAFENWIAENKFRSRYEAWKIDSNRLSESEKRYRTFILVARKHS